jgi:transposase
MSKYRECPKCRDKDGKPLTLRKKGRWFYCRNCGYRIKRADALAVRLGFTVG